jgi:hypothetical protein
MDDQDRIDIRRSIIADPATARVVFEPGTCVLLARPTGDPAAEARALLRACGPVRAGSAAGVFGVSELEGARALS